MTHHKPISLLVVSTSLNSGGAERFTSTLLGHLDRSLVQPSLALLRDDIGYPLKKSVKFHHLHYDRATHLPRAVRNLRRVVEQTRPDIVLSNITATNLVTGLALRRIRHRPIWLARIGNAPSHHDTFARRCVARRVYPFVDRFVVNSKGLVQDLVGCYPVADGRISVLPNPTDFGYIDRQAAMAPDHPKPKDRPLLVAAGRLFQQKRYDVMIDAFARVRKKRPAILWICGEGPARRRLESQINKQGLHDSVRLLGFCGNPYALMMQADLFLMSSDHEGSPNVLIEAQGLGVPAVSTQCPYGPDEIIANGQTGQLTPVGDAVAMSETIAALLDNESRRQRMATAAKQLTRERFAAEQLTRKWEELLFEQTGRQLPGPVHTQKVPADFGELVVGGTVPSCNIS